MFRLLRRASGVVTACASCGKSCPLIGDSSITSPTLTTGERLWDSEVSSVDTAILLCGILTCRQHFQHSEISQLAYEIFNRVDWTWLSEDTSLLPHGWTPEMGFLPYRWDYYSELMMMYLLGLGSVRLPAAGRDLDCLEANHFRI